MMQKVRFSDQLNRLLSRGRLSFTRTEALASMELSPTAFDSASDRAIKRGELLHVRRGFYVIVPPQYRGLGAPPANQIIDDLMRFEAAPYYVGLLKAAELHGAAHQAVMDFQIVSPKRMPDIDYGRSRLTFFYRRAMPDQRLMMTRKTEAGFYNVSGVGLTAVDLLRYSAAAGTLDAAATVIAELAPDIDAAEFPFLESASGLPTLQRLGYILDQVGAAEIAEDLHRYIAGRGRKIALDTFSLVGDSEDAHIDDRWKMVVQHTLEIDRDSEELSARLG